MAEIWTAIWSVGDFRLSMTVKLIFFLKERPNPILFDSLYSDEGLKWRSSVDWDLIYGRKRGQIISQPLIRVWTIWYHCGLTILLPFYRYTIQFSVQYNKNLSSWRGGWMFCYLWLYDSVLCTQLQMIFRLITSGSEKDHNTRGKKERKRELPFDHFLSDRDDHRMAFNSIALIIYFI